jgi:hypothetical protein
MDHIGIDVHKKGNQICVLAEEGDPLERWVRSTPRGLAALGHERSS